MMPRSPGSVGSLSLALFHRWEPDRLFMILTAYLDEAGTHGGSPVTIMAGYVGRLGQWRHFDEKWWRLLKRYELSHLHSIDMLQAKGQFKKGWDQERALELLHKTQKIINKHTMFAISTVLSDDDYKTFYAIPPKSPKARLDTRYGLCFKLAMIYIMQRIQFEEKRNDISVNFVLESGHKNAGDVVRIFDLAKKEAPFSEKLGYLSFGNKKDVPALQAADSVASPVFRVEKSPPEEPLYAPDNVTNEPLAIGRRRVNGDTPVYRLELTPDVLREQREFIDKAIELRRQFGQQRSRSLES